MATTDAGRDADLDAGRDAGRDADLDAGSARRRRGARTLGAAFVVLLLVVGVTAMPGTRRALLDPAGREAQVGATQVEVRDDVWEYFAFSPSVIEVPVGTEVTWTFASRAPHDVVFADVASPLLESGSWSRTFDAPGTFPYTCSLHTNMDGLVRVTN